MKKKDSKNKSAKASESTKKVAALKTTPRKVAKASVGKASITKKKTVSIKPAIKAKTVEKKSKTTKPALKKKTPAPKIAVTTKPKTKVSKVSAAAPKPAKVTTKPAPKKKTPAPKIAVTTKPKTKVSKVSAAAPKPAKVTTKPAPKKKTPAPKIAVTTKPKTKVSKVSAAAPKPAIKKEPAVAPKPSLRSVPAIKKSEVREEPKPKAEQYALRSSRTGLKIFLPDQDVTEEEAEEIFFGSLPEEYGENAVIALVVDPNTVFVDWEVIPRDIYDMAGELNLRFYDVTGIEWNDWNAHNVLDIRINKRVGSGFFTIAMPGRDVVVAVGILSPDSGFMPIVRSDTVSFPELLTFDELGIVQKLFESGIPVGY